MSTEEVMELLKTIEPLNSDAYILRADINHQQQIALCNAWTDIQDTIMRRIPLFIIPNSLNIQALSYITFDFSMAIRLLQLGYKVERATWTQGHIYMDGTVIRQSHDSKEWTPTQGAIRAVNWRLA